jgi:hypothetical protein
MTKSKIKGFTMLFLLKACIIYYGVYAMHTELLYSNVKPSTYRIS